MQFVALDAETYWSQDFSLSKMTNEAYIRDPRFKVHGWGIMPLGKPGRWLSHEQFVRFSDKYDWSDTAIICHNTRFDGAILGWKYGIKPKLWVDTMGMYRALFPGLRSHSLAKLGLEFGFGAKGNSDWTKGVETMTPKQFDALGLYCMQDCYLTHRLFEKGWHRFPPFERAIMDMTLRMFIEPVFHVDSGVLATFLASHVAEKAELLSKCGVSKTDIMSNEKFARALAVLGVVPPLKPSPSNANKTTYAFAKTDAAMDELADHEDSRVQTLVAARLGNKSTLLETRIRHVLEIGARGTLPVPLNYWGAKVTGRHSGGDDLNMQNFTRGSVLRKGVLAPPGMMIVVGDSSNIELRLVMALAGQWDAIEKIRAGVDLYCDFATDIYGRPITKDDTDERFVGKQGMLSLQYMASASKFGNMLRQKKHPIPASEAEKVKDTYRRKHNKVVSLWYYCDETVLPAIGAGTMMCPVDVNGWFLTTRNGFALPGELGVQYPGIARGLHVNTVTGTSRDGWRYDSGRGERDLYGAKLVENLCQHAARQVVMYQGLLVRTRYPVVHSVHDELVCCVPEDEAEDCAAFMRECLTTAPKWTRGKLPVAGEVGIGRSYGEAK